MHIRNEEPKDMATVYFLNAATFETSAEADLFKSLRDQAQPIISIIAEDKGEIIGYVMFSPVTLSQYPTLKMMELAPMAVAPDHQWSHYPDRST